MKVVLVPLRQLLCGGVAEGVIQRSFDRFRCERDSDVAFFLSRYALANERIGASRSYLALEKDALEKESKLVLVAFFTLAIAVTDYGDTSNRLKRKIMGNYPRVSRETHFPGFLLGQLARDDRYTKDDFDCGNLLGEAERIVQSASNAVGGNILYLDCKEPLVKYYEGYGYSVLTQAAPCGFYKMFKCLPRLKVAA